MDDAADGNRADTDENDSEYFMNYIFKFWVVIKPGRCDPETTRNQPRKDRSVDGFDNEVIEYGLGLLSERFNNCTDNVLGQKG